MKSIKKVKFDTKYVLPDGTTIEFVKDHLLICKGDQCTYLQGMDSIIKLLMILDKFIIAHMNGDL